MPMNTMLFLESSVYYLLMNNMFISKQGILLLTMILICARPGAEPVYRIVADNYVITGRTQQSVLTKILGNASGQEFTSLKDIETFGELRKNRLENMRAFRETAVSLIYENEENGIIPVTLETSIKDGTPFLPIPYMFYNSNEGFLGGIVVNAPNLNGTLQNLVGMGLYAAPPDEQDNLRWTEPNFMVLVNWSGIRIDSAVFRFTLMAMRMNRKIENLGYLKNKFLAHSFTGIVTTEVPLTDTISSKTTVNYTYCTDYTITYITDETLLPWGPLDSTLRMDTGLVFYDFQWNGNFRSGWKAEATAGVEWINPALAAKHSSLIGEAELAAFIPVSQRINPQARLSGFARTGKPVLDAGKKVRGIRNGEMRGSAGVFLNTGIQVLIAKFGSTELHMTPCIDAVWLYTDKADTRIHDFGLAAGFEILLFMDTLKSLPIKLGAAYDLRSDNKNGSGKFYEIDFSFALTY